MNDYAARQAMRAHGFKIAAEGSERYKSPLLEIAWTAYAESGGNVFTDEHGQLTRPPKTLKRSGAEIMAQSRIKSAAKAGSWAA